MMSDEFIAAALRNPVSEAIASELSRMTERYRTTPDVKPGLRCGGLISFFRKHRGAFPA